MNFGELVKRTSAKTGFTQADVKIALDEAFNIIHDTLEQGQRVSFRGFFSIRPFFVKGYKINNKTVVNPHIRYSFELKRKNIEEK